VLQLATIGMMLAFAEPSVWQTGLLINLVGAGVFLYHAWVDRMAHGRWWPRGVGYLVQRPAAAVVGMPDSSAAAHPPSSRPRASSSDSDRAGTPPATTLAAAAASSAAAGATVLMKDALDGVASPCSNPHGPSAAAIVDLATKRD